MSDRSGRLFRRLGTQIAPAGLVASMLAISCDTGWPQAAPSLGLQSPAQQAVPAQPEPQQIAPSPPREENPGLINEIGKLFEKSKLLLPPLKSPGGAVEDPDAGSKGAGESLSNIV